MRQYDLDNFQRRVLQDALAEGERRYWLRRAAVFEAARPRRGDYFGRATREQVTQRDRRLAEVAQACRNRAAVAGGRDG